MDRFDLYELSVQKPAHAVALLRAIHGRAPRVLAEDFSGTAAVSRAWVRMVEDGRAIAVDRDAEALSRARGHAGLHVIEGDVRELPSSAVARTDVVFVGNFSIGELHTRRELVAYLRRSRERLEPHGVFVCDTYGGASAFRTGAIERMHAGPNGTCIRYTWEQRRADPITARVENALHFRVERAGEIVQEITDAFVYRWRLWSVPELCDALVEAGFASTEVHAELPETDAAERAIPLEDPGALPESFIVCVAGRLGA